jgi:sulfide:quinone oxidoreductase
VASAPARHSTARVLVSGGGIAALETALALDRLAHGRVAVELISPRRDFIYRPRPGWTPLGGEAVARFDLESFAAGVGAEYRSDVLAEVRVAEQEAVTRAGTVLPYDALVIAHGAAAHSAIPGAIPFWTRDDADILRTVLSGLERGELGGLALALPAGMPWSLPLYELALLAAERARAGRAAGIVVVTPELRPLELFGEQAAAAIEAILLERGVEVRGRAVPIRFAEGGLELESGDAVEAGQAVALPRLRGREVAGLPADELGFVETGSDGRVLGVDAVYAAGDATALPVKQGLFAGAQADAVAEHLAASLGAELEPTPFRPVLRGTLATKAGPLSSLWWPSSGFAGSHLTPHLAAKSRAAVRVALPEAEGIPVEVELPLAA